MGESEWLTVPEVADRWRVSRMTVYRMIELGDLAALRVGRSFRVPVEVVVAREASIYE